MGSSLSPDSDDEENKNQTAGRLSDGSLAKTTDISDNKSKVKQWLNNLDLNQYYDIFVENGYESMQYLEDIQSKNDLIDINITSELHQYRILDALNKRRKPKDINDTNDTNNIRTKPLLRDTTTPQPIYRADGNVVNCYGVEDE